MSMITGLVAATTRRVVHPQTCRTQHPQFYFLLWSEFGRLEQERIRQVGFDPDRDEPYTEESETDEERNENRVGADEYYRSLQSVKRQKRSVASSHSAPRHTLTSHLRRHRRSICSSSASSAASSDIVLPTRQAMPSPYLGSHQTSRKIIADESLDSNDAALEALESIMIHEEFPVALKIQSVGQQISFTILVRKEQVHSIPWLIDAFDWFWMKRRTTARGGTTDTS